MITKPITMRMRVISADLSGGLIRVGAKAVLGGSEAVLMLPRDSLDLNQINLGRTFVVTVTDVTEPRQGLLLGKVGETI